MSKITQKQHNDLIETLLELQKAVENTRKVSTSDILFWLQKEIQEWLSYLKNHDDTEELHSLKIEIVKRYVHKYEVLIEPYFLDRRRRELFEKLIKKFNDVLQLN